MREKLKDTEDNMEMFNSTSGSFRRNLKMTGDYPDMIKDINSYNPYPAMRKNIKSTLKNHHSETVEL